MKNKLIQGSIAIAAMILIGVIVQDVLGMIAFGAVSIFLINSHVKITLFEVILLTFEFIMISIASRYINLSFYAENISIVLVVLMSIIVFKSRFSFRHFMEFYRDYSIKVIIVTLLSCLVLVINTPLALVMMMTTIVMTATMTSNTSMIEGYN